MKTRAWQDYLSAGKLGVVVVAAAAVVVSGADAASRLFAAYQSAERPHDYSFDQHDLSALPEEAPGEMATTGRPNAEPSGYLLTTLHIQGQSQDSRQVHSTANAAPVCHSLTEGERTERLFCSLGPISTELGHRQTLVGAVPSGTS